MIIKVKPDAQTLRNHMHQGQLAEFVVALDISAAGYRVAVTPIEGSAFDLLVDTDEGLKTVQVKSTTALGRKGSCGRERYSFGHQRGNGGFEKADIYAFVAFPEDEVLYLSRQDLVVNSGKKHFGPQSYRAQAEGSLARVMENF